MWKVKLKVVNKRTREYRAKIFKVIVDKWCDLEYSVKMCKKCKNFVVSVVF